MKKLFALFAICLILLVTEGVNILAANGDSTYNDMLAYKFGPDYKGYRGLVLAGGHFSQLTDEYGANFSVQAIHGMTWNRFLTTSLGTGIEWFEIQTVIPLFIDVRGYLLTSDVTPFYFAGTGYAFGPFDKWIYKMHGGFMWQAGGGLSFRREFGNLLFSMGYRYQRTSRKVTSGRDSYTRSYRFNRLSIHLGFVF